ncbi:gamma-glutamyl-gamma-aminobutyrate hydrolase family protein [Anaerobacillus sp. CMMVII]|uniref:gamma-glutamyl-gamma-aminobutyrate hydrolase family protein n=1 Tax=Anaerobacillus sp. CMMVII TaxID=2755588 RepID=UPI0021B84269|nr:gamma-glutamyl-gamma-aminobutyrate hydrolase family protein [Anaerobacillus sp. CMMVII]MCT8139184.1 gamma-glutamyl-gamma-aminobutyrate hydrolase family protein [Anaerobacillus sp. CMMVII]
MNPITKPIIGISSSIERHKNIPSVHVHEKYARAVIQGGGLPVILPIGPIELAKNWISMCDGLILSSGEDIDPHSYHRDPSPQLQKINGKRDKLEIELIHQAQKQRKPILAICRGITMLNAALGGTVIQDIPSILPNAINHFQQAERPEATHSIKIEVSSRLYQILHRSSIRVNSLHHQCIELLAPSLKIVATAPDGVIEAVEGINHSPVVLGFQWHPEEMAVEEPSMMDIFKEFIAECKKS